MDTVGNLFYPPPLNMYLSVHVCIISKKTHSTLFLIGWSLGGQLKHATLEEELVLVCCFALPVFILWFYFAALGMEPRASCMPGKQATPPALFGILEFWIMSVYLFGNLNWNYFRNLEMNHSTEQGQRDTGTCSPNMSREQAANRGQCRSSRTTQGWTRLTFMAMTFFPGC